MRLESSEDDYLSRSFMTCIPHLILFKWQNQELLARHVECMSRREVHLVFCWGNLREKDHLEDLGVYGTIILKQIFKKWHGDMD